MEMALLPRDFCFIENVVQANLLAATLGNKNILINSNSDLALNQIYNIACEGANI